MELYIIALKELGISNELILDIMNTFQNNDYTQLFNGNYLSLQLKYNIGLDKYNNTFTNLVLLSESLKKSKEIIKASKKHKIKIALLGSKYYPKNLSEIHNPPAIIYFRGKGFYNKHIKSIGCVGTREITDFGINAVNSIVPKLVNEDFVIVSGLAEGTDTLSHKTCIENKGITIAVLAHGLDMIYPKQNEALADEILKNNGLLVSEYPIGTKPDKFRFIDRNRIISGLSKSIVVIEAKEKSGTMHTANFAIEQNKPIFCPYPTNKTNTTTGLVKLIEEKKATPILTRSSYDTIIIGTGYKIKDKVKFERYKNKTAASFISNIKLDSKDISNDISFDEIKHANIKVDKKLYEEYKKIIKKNYLSNKDMFNSFMLAVIKAFHNDYNN